MRPLNLNILFNTDDTDKLSLLDLNVKLKDCEVREMTFYRIDAISPHFEGDENINQYCMIHSNADEFICVDTYDNVKQKIFENL